MQRHPDNSDCSSRKKVIFETAASPLLVVLLVFMTAGFYLTSTYPPAEEVVLPIKVYPEDGVSEHIESVVLDVANPSSVNRLYVQAHQPFYHRGGVKRGVNEGFDPERAAEIRINNGSWIQIRDEEVTCAWPEEGYDCVAGAFSTIRFSVPANNVREGDNLIEFKFNGTDGIRSGYRITSLGFMNAADDLQTFDPFVEGAHDYTLLRRANFAQWESPAGVNSSSAVQSGEELWHKESALVENIQSGEPIQASCSSCHARDGRDLKYFNYSNRVIVARSRFHGLTEEEGKQIAAYIRSIKLEKRNGATYEAPGTPWNPPYQPGPELVATGEHPDKSNQAFWAAGAGLEWVLDNDEEMLPYLFPDGNGGVDRLPDGSLDWRHIHMDSTLNMRAMPIAIQLPDWNNWLPDIHPMDAYPGTFTGSETQQHYEGEFQGVQAAYSGGFSVQELKAINTATEKLGRKFRQDGLHNVGQSAELSSNEHAIGRSSLYQWRAVKVWEMNHANHLEDVADDFYAERDYRNEWNDFHEPRSWMGRSRTLFDIAPHINAPNGQKNPPYVYGNADMEHIMSHIWYHLQVIVNPGSPPQANSQSPVDWSYQRAHLRDAAARSGVGAGLRKFQSEIKEFQMLNNWAGVSNPPWGWGPLQNNPAAALLDIDDTSGKGYHTYKNLGVGLKKDLIDAFLSAFNEHISQFDNSEFPRGDQAGKQWPAASHVPTDEGFINPFKPADLLYRELPLAKQNLGLDPVVVSETARWAERMWPQGDWEPLIEDRSSNNIVTSITNLTSGSTFQAPANLAVEVDAHQSNGAIQKVELLTDGTKLGEDAEAPYRIAWEDAPPGNYTLTARATGEDGAVVTSASVQITVTGETVSQRIPLQKGWNLISSRIAPSDASLSSVFAGVLSNLVSVEDKDGNIFAPDRDTNGIGTWDAREAYMVYMQGPDTLHVEGVPVSSDASITLKAGWNMVPYLGKTPSAVEEVLSSISSEVVLVKDGAGRTYAPAYKINEIGKLKPGKGYRVHVSKDITFVYPESIGGQ